MKPSHSYCLILSLLLCAVLSGVQAQPLDYHQIAGFTKANSTWALGQGSGLNFNSGTATPITTAMDAWEGAASVSDPVTGNLLFYSDGKECRNANHLVMPNGSGLTGNQGSSTQGVVAIPMIDNPGKYYLFSLYGPTESPYYPSFGTLFYSVVDMSLNGGLGDIASGQKNILFSSDSLSESMIVIPGNHCDLWLMLHSFVKPVFKAYHITSTGIDPVPVISTTGTEIQGWSSTPSFSGHAYEAGCMAVSPDRQKLAICSDVMTAGAGGVILARFNPNTGQVYDGLKINGWSTYSVAFSPDNTKLYTTSKKPSSTLYTSKLVQYDISSFNAAIIATTQTFLPNETSSFHSSYLRQFEEKIYVNTLCSQCTSHNLGVIQAPDNAGVSCNYQHDAVSLTDPGFPGSYALPNEVVYTLPPDTSYKRVLDTLVCTVDSIFTPLQLTAVTGHQDYLWDDGSSDTTRDISAAGTYWVAYKESFCKWHKDSFLVRQSDLSFSLGPDREGLCKGEQSSFDLILPKYQNTTYLWSDGSNKNAINIKEPGRYWVTLTNQDGCRASDTVEIGYKDFLAALSGDTSICRGEPIDITLTVNVPPGAQAKWSDGNTTASITIHEPGTYWVMVADPLCKESDTVKILEEVCICDVKTPNAFTPNGDGLNDIFSPVLENGCPVTKYAFSVYNRFGQRIFFSADPAKGWDGLQNGRPADVGTYFFNLQFEAGSRKIPVYRKGDLALIR